MLQYSFAKANPEQNYISTTAILMIVAFRHRISTSESKQRRKEKKNLQRWGKWWKIKSETNFATIDIDVDGDGIHDEAMANGMHRRVHKQSSPSMHAHTAHIKLINSTA